MDCLLQFENILQEKRPQRNQKNNTSFPRSVCVSSLQTNSYSNSQSEPPWRSVRFHHHHLKRPAMRNQVVPRSRVPKSWCEFGQEPRILPRQAVQTLRPCIPARPIKRTHAPAPPDPWLAPGAAAVTAKRRHAPSPSWTWGFWDAKRSLSLIYFLLFSLAVYTNDPCSKFLNRWAQ